MKTIVTLLALVSMIGVSLDAQSPDQTSTVHTKSVSMDLFETCRRLILDVAQVTTDTTTETRVNYLFVDRCTLQLIGRALGVIPNEHLKMASRGGRLSTTIFARPGLEVDGLTGDIDIEWTPNGVRLLRSNGQTAEVLLGERFKQQHVSSSESADVNGVFLGVPLEDVPGSINTSVNHFVQH